MLLSCWAYDPERRPGVDLLVETLLANSELVVPCLDAPVSAVAMDCTGSIEMAIPRRQPSRLRMALRISGEHSSHISNGFVPGGGLTISPTSLSLGTDTFGYTSTLPCPNNATLSHMVCGIANGDLAGNSCGNGGSEDLRCRLNSAGLSEIDQKTETVSGSLCASDVISDHRSSNEQLFNDVEDDDEEEEGSTAGPCSEVMCPDSPPPQHSCSTSPPTPDTSLPVKYIALPTVSLEERADSDYCSDHSKEFWNISSSTPNGHTGGASAV